jgi:hypothetical protein
MVTVTQDLKLIQASWAKYGNSIMINGWNDMKQQKIINKSLLQSLPLQQVSLLECMATGLLVLCFMAIFLQVPPIFPRVCVTSPKGSISRCAVRY